MTSSAVTAPVVAYSAPFQTLAADELARLGPPCPRDEVIPGCSALARMTIDYKEMRDKTRAISR